MLDFKECLTKTQEIGYIVGIQEYLIYVSGLPSLKLEEMVITESLKIGIVFRLREEVAEILVFNTENLRIGERVAKTNSFFKIPCSFNLLGRIVNSLGLPIDEKGPVLGEKEYLPIKKEVPGITQRKRITKPLETGVMIVDVLVPIGYGQRELIIGDAKTGKTTFLLQTMVNQSKKGVICIYVGIGKEVSAIKAVESYLKEMNVFEKTIIIAGTSNDITPLNYLAPFCGMTLSEYFQSKGKNVLIVFDDLTRHAQFYREISLLVKRLPGRSAYPGDIFHLHAELLERAGNIINSQGEEASITALPVVETLENDLSGYIQTNLMAMTDGHIFFDVNESKRGKLPPVNTFLSVSRVGNQTKTPLERELALWIRKILAEYQRIKDLSRFGEELSKESQEILELGEKIEILFNQDSKTIIPRKIQLLLSGLLISNFWKGKSENVMKREIKTILENKEEILKIKEIVFEKIKSLLELEKITKDLFVPKVKKILYQF